MSPDELYMSRCLQLAKLGEANVSPNPMVGAVLVHEGHIIGEGYHEQYGSTHAEVNCVNSVAAVHRHLVPESILYVSLEPCAHFGKTPPCADFIINEQIKRVVVATRDPFEKVDGAGIEKLLAAGVDVNVGILQKEAQELNKQFFYFHKSHQPFISLKWAETTDGFIAGKDYQAVAISNEISNRWVHHLRATHAAIIVGYNTAKYDNPALTTRLWPGTDPLRIVIDKQLTLDAKSRVLTDGASTLVLNYLQQKTVANIEYYLLNKDEPVLQQLLTLLYQRNISSLLVEGGAGLLQSFIDEDCWNEAYCIKSNTGLGEGIKGPSFLKEVFKSKSLLTDNISIYKNY